VLVGIVVDGRSPFVGWPTGGAVARRWTLGLRVRVLVLARKTGAAGARRGSPPWTLLGSEVLRGLLRASQAPSKERASPRKSQLCDSLHCFLFTYHDFALPPFRAFQVVFGCGFLVSGHVSVRSVDIG
jgi:hypothetical protein